MRNFKEIVSYFNYEHLGLDSGIHSVTVETEKRLMLGTVVRLKNEIIVPTDSTSYDIIGVVVDNEDEFYHCVATCGTVYCICKHNNYKVNDYVKVCELYGAANKFTDRRMNPRILNKFCIGQVVEDRDLRTSYLGYVKIKLGNNYPCTICLTKST